MTSDLVVTRGLQRRSHCLVQTEREKIAAEYRAAVSAYSKAVAAMEGLRDAEFEKARLAAKHARLICEEWRRMLENYDVRSEQRDAAAG